MDSGGEHGFRSSWQKALRWSREVLKFPNSPTAQKKHSTNMVNKEGVALGAGVLLLVVGFFLALTWDQILESQVSKEFILSESSVTYRPWKKTSVDVYLKFYFWNWTNPKGLREPGYKPILEQLGPYTYREVAEKVDIVWNTNGTVTYKRLRRWYFAPEESNGTQDDLITTLNVVAKSAAFITRNSNYVTRMGLNVAMSSTQSIDVTKPVRQLLFEGYRNTLLDTAKNLPFFSGVKIPFDRFGWFYKRNGTSDLDGVFNIETGANGMDSFGKIRTWNYQNHTPFFEGECGAVRGSGGEFFPPKRTKQDILEMFSPDLCRYVTFRYAREEVLQGLTAYRYETRSSMLDNGEEDSANSCFCGGECAPPGALNVSTCRLGAPAFVSFPHFYMADSVYREGVVGMKPDPKRHGAHITMEPTYGIPLDVHVSFQINIFLQPYSDISMYQGLTPTYFPVLWFEQTASISEDTAKALKTLLILPTIGMCVAAILLVSGTALVITVVSLRYCRAKRQVQINDDAKGVAEPMIQENGVGNGKDIEIKPTTESTRWDTRL